MIDHVTLGVHHLDESRFFYEHALRPLGLTIVLELSDQVGFGDGSTGRPFFFLVVREPSHRVHVAFAAPDRAGVDAFHAAALHAGGVDNGPPGLRPHYHEHYYGAFVFDADGNNIEAVSHTPRVIRHDDVSSGAADNDCVSVLASRVSVGGAWGSDAAEHVMSKGVEGAWQ